MAEFIETRRNYNTEGLNFREAAEKNYIARQQYYRLDKEIQLFLRKNLIADLPSNHALNKRKKDTLKLIEESEKEVSAARKALEASRVSFDQQGSADQTIKNLDDDFPVLLLPLQVQTRFLTRKFIARECPDELLIDVGKVDPNTRVQIQRILPDLKPVADPEHNKGSQAFMLSNNDSPAARSLVSRLNRFSPLQPPVFRWRKVEDEYELWVRIFPDDIFLQTHEKALTEKEFSAAREFWQEMWIAEREFRLNQADPGTAGKIRTDKQLAAWKTLRFECLPHRALWIARVMRPKEYPDQLDSSLESIPGNKFPEPGIKAEPWTLPPVTNLLPEHFMVRISFNRQEIPSREMTGAAVPDYIQLGFDPDEADENAFSRNGRVLELPAPIRWLTDFKEAEKAGMAIRIPLSTEEVESGISRLLVLGVKTGADPSSGGELLTELFEDHRLKPDGMSFISRGTPTNNLEGQQNGRLKKELSDEDSFNLEFPAGFSADPASDGSKLAHVLGMDLRAFTRLYNHDDHEGEEARMMNKALWPGTLGYFLDNHMRPAVKDADIGFIKKFFQNHVAGGGLLPSLRIGKQPYGIVPATAWAAWETGPSASLEERRLADFLKKMDGEWARLIVKVKTMKKVFENSKEQVVKKEFRELLACQASSTRYFRRLVAGEYLLWNMNKRVQPPGTEKTGIRTTPSEYKSRVEKANAWNAPMDPLPRMLGKFMDNENYKLFDAPSGQRNRTDSGKNLLALLLDATQEQLKNNSFGDDLGKFVSQRSDRLIFHVSRFALLQEWIRAATEIVRTEDPKISPFARLDFEMEYVAGGRTVSLEHESLQKESGFADKFETLKNKWSFLEQTLTNGKRVDETIINKLQGTLQDDDPAASLKEVIEALAGLADLPSERLERLFSEHIDTCSFRLDAWMQGLVLSRLFENRKKEGKGKGIYLGAFGYLENLKPDPDPWVEASEIKNPDTTTSIDAGMDNLVMPVYDFSGLSQGQIQSLKKTMFVYLGSDPVTNLAEDPSTGIISQLPVSSGKGERGFILTPSLEHAGTAGILRAGYEHHGRSPGQGSDSLAIKLEPVRTGKAIEMLKALNAGFSLNEQLGYFIERNMHDNPQLAAFVPATRKAFPLHIEKNEWDDDQQLREENKVNNLELIADGLAILNKFQNPSVAPSWQSKLNEIFSTNQQARTAFEGVINLAADLFDAVSDLILAESVYQKVKGSPEKASAALRMAGEGSDITLPEIAGIPSEKRVLNHRMGYILNGGGGTAMVWPSGTAISSFLPRLTPDLNSWLADQLPLPGKIFARVIRENGEPLKISLSTLGIQPVDFYYMIRHSGGKPDQSLLNWLFLEAAKNADPGSLKEVSYERDENSGNSEFSIVEILPMIRSIGDMLDKARPLRPEDLMKETGSGDPSAADHYDNTSMLSTFAEILGNKGDKPFKEYLKTLQEAKNRMEKNIPSGFGTPEAETSFKELFRQIPQAYTSGFRDALPRCPEVINELNARILIDQADNMISTLTARSGQIGALWKDIVSVDGSLPEEEVFEMLKRLGRLLAGEDFLLLPEFSLPDTAGIKTTFNDQELAASVKESNLREWIQGLALVRDNIRCFQMIGNLRKIYGAAADKRNLKILQLPHLPGGGNHWIGGRFPEGFEPPAGATSLAFEFSAGFSEGEKISGILVDEWREKIPLPEITGGIAIHYNQANSEAPQCMLLAVSPTQKGAWDWENLAGSVIETMTMAKKRAIDTEILQTSWVSQFLPALVTPVDDRNNTPNLNFGVAGPGLKIPPVFRPDIGGGGGGVIARF